MDETVVTAATASVVTLGLVTLWLKARADRARSRARWLEDFYAE